MAETYNNEENRSLLDKLDSAEERARTIERKPTDVGEDYVRRSDDSGRQRQGSSRSQDAYFSSEQEVPRRRSDNANDLGYRRESASRNGSRREDPYGDRRSSDGRRCSEDANGSSRERANREDAYRNDRNSGDRRTSDGRVRREDAYRDGRSGDSRRRSDDAYRRTDSNRDSGNSRERANRNLDKNENTTAVATRSNGEVANSNRTKGEVSVSRSRGGSKNSLYYNDGRGSGGQYRGNGNKKRKKKKKGSKAFIISLVIFAAVLIIGVVIAISTLSSFLKTYEMSLPVNVVEQVVDELKEGKYKDKNIVAYDETPISDEAAFAKDGFFSEYFKNHMNAGDVTYRKLNGESTDTKFVYAIKVGDEDFLKIYLDKQTEKQKFDLNTWKMAGGQVLDDKLVTKTIRIQAPQNAKVYVNGIEVGDDKMVSGNVVVEQLQNLVNSGFLAEENAAYVKELSVEGLFASGDTKVTLTNADGTEEECVLNNDLYSGGFKATEEFAAARIDRVTEMIYPWCYYFSGDGSFWTLSQYLWDYSPAYNTIQAADTSWMQEHSDIGIDNIVVDNFRNYSDTCWSCDVRFQENIYQWGTLARTWDSYMTWIYINGDSTFYLADYITHNASEK